MNERTKQDRHETPVGVHYVPGVQRGSLVDKGSLWDAHIVPDNEYEALMECGPHETPREHDNMMSANFETLLDQVLTPKEKAVIEMMFVGGMSGTEAGELLARQFSNKNRAYNRVYIYKLRDSALAKLREHYGIVLEETDEPVPASEA